MIRKLFFISLIALILNFAIADKFTWNFYKKFAATRTNENFVISPASLALVLGLAKEGATNDTKKQMDGALSGTEFNLLNERLRGEKTLKSGSKIFVREGFTVKRTYESIARTNFNSVPDFVDFSKSQKAAKKINDWIEESTEGVLKDVVSPSALTADMSMLLINTIFFKGAWVNGFNVITDPRQQRNFYITKENHFLMDGMETDEKKFNYTESDELKLSALELPYEGTDLKMVILLPNFGKTLREVEEKLNDESLKKLLSTLEPRDATVTMPKIKIESDFSCNEELKQLGMKKMFGDNAEFSEFVTQPVGMKISDVRQKAFIDINEHGTVAAAASGIKFVLLCIGCGPVDFAVNRPFLFLIKDKDFIYFMGRVVDPRL